MKTILILISCLCILVGCGSTSSNQGTATTPTATNTKSTPTSAPTQHFKVGQTVNIGNTWQVAVFAPSMAAHGNYSRPQKPGYVYLVFAVAVKNISSQEQTISSVAEFTLTDSTGQKYNLTYDDASGATLDGKVEPGDPLKGSLAYEVPKDVHDFRLAFAPELFQSGQSIWDIKV